MSGKKRSLCPECGKHASGNFCQNCGVSLGGRFCDQCGAELRGSFCNECGAPAAAGQTVVKAPPGASAGGAQEDPDLLRAKNLPWWIAGVSALAVIFVIGWNLVESGQRQVPVQSAPSTVPPTADLSQLTPRQSADQLFNRVMGASEAGDTATVGQFISMALQAYEAARPLDLDGLFHLAQLQRIAGMYEGSLATALEILSSESTHIMGLEVAGQAAAALGRDDEAADYFQMILDNYDTEVERPLPEYQSHTNYFGLARTAAREFLDQR
jgi:tetratricopeptide (TPR) repeat protein